MPRKMRPGKSRRVTGWELETLDQLRDVLALQSGCIGSTFFYPRERIHNLEDARQPWDANRHLLLKMCTCHLHPPRCPDHELKYQPGERPWAWWHFDMGRDVPRDQETELRRLGLITAAEQRALDAQHGPPAETGEPAEVIEFPTDDAEDE